MASNTKGDSRILPNFKLVKDFMPVLFICKFRKGGFTLSKLTWSKLINFDQDAVYTIEVVQNF